MTRFVMTDLETGEILAMALTMEGIEAAIRAGGGYPDTVLKIRELK